ncbi:prepilin-type N-terminal cleavage/methylation domain-containing protein [Spirochaetota bacterium]
MRETLHRFDNRGFTLIEILIAVVVISIVAVVVVPRFTHFFSGTRENFSVTLGMITKTFDDSFINNRINYLTLHLHSPDSEEIESTLENKIFQRRNGISVVNLIKGEFKDNKRRLLKFKKFPESFKLEEVVLSSGEVITEGNVLIPFYPQGFSDNIIIHILINDEERWSVRNFKHQKEPAKFREYINFDKDK